MSKLDLVWIDVSTGEINFQTVDKEIVFAEILKIAPKEILYNEKLDKNLNLNKLNINYIKVPEIFFNSKLGRSFLEKNLGDLFDHSVLDISYLKLCGGLYFYLNKIFQDKSIYLQDLNFISDEGLMKINYLTYQNLNILSNSKSNDLFSLVNLTLTNGGKRLLKFYFDNVFLDLKLINYRLDMVDFFVRNVEKFDEICPNLMVICDLERVLASLISIAKKDSKCFSKKSQDMENIIKLNNTMNVINYIAKVLNNLDQELPKGLLDIRKCLNGSEDIVKFFSEIINFDVDENGFFIRNGYLPLFDYWNEVLLKLKSDIDLLKFNYEKDFEISNIKIKKSNLLGFYVDIPKKYSSKIKLDFFHHLSGSFYKTDELSSLEDLLFKAELNLNIIQNQIIHSICEELAKNKRMIMEINFACSLLDVVISFAKVSKDFCYPKIDYSKDLEIIDGWNPIVVNRKNENIVHFNDLFFSAEGLSDYGLSNKFNAVISKINLNHEYKDEIECIRDILIKIDQLGIEYNFVDDEIIIFEGKENEVRISTQKLIDLKNNKFVLNDTNLSKDNFIMCISGPNMGGKSTYLYQNVIICFLTHIGCFVPAKSARIGLIDGIFSRIGAAEDIMNGYSTFMVEMVETAGVLNQSSESSLLILDELGRGTSSEDGEIIAKSVISYIHDRIGCRTIFATHYHNIHDLKLSGMSSFSIEIFQILDKIICSHKIIKKACRKSYGKEIAKLAKLPSEVIDNMEKFSVKNN